MTFTDAVRSAFRNYATFDGRARRSEFWFFALFTILAQAAAGLLDETLYFGAGRGPAAGLVSLLLFLPSLAVAVRRLHDGGRSGWWILICLLPLIGWLILLIWYLSRGEAGPNRFGPDPRGFAGGPDLPWQMGPPGGGQAPPWSGQPGQPPQQGGPSRPWPTGQGRGPSGQGRPWR